MSNPTRPTRAELEADGLDPEIMIQMIDAQRAMAGECACACGIHGDDKAMIEACPSRPCYFRNDAGDIDAPYQAEAELLATRAHYAAMLTG